VVAAALQVQMVVMAVAVEVLGMVLPLRMGASAPPTKAIMVETKRQVALLRTLLLAAVVLVVLELV
jgi:hypothetical protein